MTDPRATAVALRALAAFMRGGVPLRAALVEWHREAPDELRPALQRVSRRLRLGEPVAGALGSVRDELGDDMVWLGALIEIGSRLGGDVTRAIDALADAADERGRARAAGVAAAAGAKVSGRLVAGLPLALLPLVPLARAPLLDPTGLATVALGVALAATGMAWIGRLVPRPPAEDDAAAAIAEVAAAALEGGAGLHEALDAIASVCPGEAGVELRRLKRLVVLGLSWTQALERAQEPPLRALGGAVRHAAALGLPVARALRGFARARRLEVARAFEVAVRKASVLVVVPLVVCVLPAFALIGLVPFLRSLSET